MAPITAPIVTAQPNICSRCAATQLPTRPVCQTSLLPRRAGLTPSHSDVAAKRAHRRFAISWVASHPRRQRAALFYLDDRLASAEGANQFTFFTDDLLAAGLGLAPHQFFSPNVKAEQGWLRGAQQSLRGTSWSI